MNDLVELVARAERAERRLAELQKVLRDTDREAAWHKMQDAERAVRRLRQSHRHHRHWLRRSRRADRFFWLMLGANFGYLVRVLVS